MRPRVSKLKFGFFNCNLYLLRPFFSGVDQSWGLPGFGDCKSQLNMRRLGLQMVRCSAIHLHQYTAREREGLSAELVEDFWSSWQLVVAIHGGDADMADQRVSQGRSCLWK